MLKMNDVEIFKISKNLNDYLLAEWCQSYKVISIDQDDNEILVELDGTITYDFDLDGHGGYTQQELQEMKADNIQDLKEQYDHQCNYYDDVCRGWANGDCDGQDVEEAHSEMRIAYELWKAAISK